MNQFFSWNRAQSFEEFVELHGSVLGVPWVNTAATGPGKPAYYGDVTVVPNVSDATGPDLWCSAITSRAGTANARLTHPRWLAVNVRMGQ